MLRPLTKPDSQANAPGPGRPAGEALVWSMNESIRRMRAAAPDAAAGDVEGVHRMRVATRRLRSSLRILRALVKDSWSRPLRDELRWLGGILGNLRDLDVLDGRLRRNLDPNEVAALGPFLAEVDRRRIEARGRLTEALDSRRYHELVDHLTVALERPAWKPAAAEPAREALPRLVRGAWKKLRKRGRTLAPDDPDEAYHRLRIDAKRARYAAEAVAPSLGRKGAEAARKFASAAQALQDVLGEHQDATCARAELVRALARYGDEPGFAPVAARLAQRERTAADAARAAFPAAWCQLDRPKLRRWMRD